MAEGGRHTQKPQFGRPGRETCLEASVRHGQNPRLGEFWFVTWPDRDAGTVLQNHKHRCIEFISAVFTIRTLASET